MFTSWFSLLKCPMMIYQQYSAGRWFSPGTLVSSTNKTDCHDITEILLKVALNTITLTSTGFLSLKTKMMFSKNNVIVNGTLPFFKTIELYLYELDFWSDYQCLHSFDSVLKQLFIYLLRNVLHNLDWEGGRF